MSSQISSSDFLLRDHLVVRPIFCYPTHESKRSRFHMPLVESTTTYCVRAACKLLPASQALDSLCISVRIIIMAESI